jgi:hypothetical protein
LLACSRIADVVAANRADTARAAGAGAVAVVEAVAFLAEVGVADVVAANAARAIGEAPARAVVVVGAVAFLAEIDVVDVVAADFALTVARLGRKVGLATLARARAEHAASRPVALLASPHTGH